jgi:hypothetical protein
MNLSLLRENDPQIPEKPFKMQRLLPATAAGKYEHFNIFELEILILILLVYLKILDDVAIRLSPSLSMSLRAIENTLNAFMFTTRLIKFR